MILMKMLGRTLKLSVVLVVFALGGGTSALDAAEGMARDQNDPARVEWFRDLGFGLFVHWSVDGQLGSVISHSMPGASDDYLQRFITELPKTFYPERFDPRKWARLAKIAGMKYVMFTTKHHAGFCMFATQTTDFGVMHTPFHRDIVGEVVTAFREQDIGIGLYFSCDDFSWLYRNGKLVNRDTSLMPHRNPELLRYAQAQLHELLTHYGSVDLMFFDGQSLGLADYVWGVQPQVVVTAGAMKVAEQNIPGGAQPGPFESCFTMGTEWPYRPLDTYKSSLTMINMLIETRAKGGNLLLNIGPKPDGDIAQEQEDRLRQIGYWLFINGEAIYNTRRWAITNEGDSWFTKKKDEDTVYVFVRSPWKYAAWRDLRLGSLKSTAKTSVSVLGQSGRVLEYQPNVTPETTWRQQADGLHIRAMRAQRTFTNNQDPNPVVLKITHVQSAVEPADLPQVMTARGRWNEATQTAVLEGNLQALGNVAEVEVGFEYRNIKGMDTNERTEPWIALPRLRRKSTGAFNAEVRDWKAGDQYEFRAVATHPLLPVYGQEKKFTVQ